MTTTGRRARVALCHAIAPGVRRVAVVHNPDVAVNVAFLRAAEAASTSLGVTVTAAGLTRTGICCTTAWVAGSIRDTVPPVPFTAQTEPSP